MIAAPARFIQCLASEGVNVRRGVVIRRMAGILELAECLDEPLHWRGEQIPVLVQVGFGVAVSHAAVCSLPSVLLKIGLWPADQTIGVAAGQRVEHGVVRGVYRPSDGTG